MWTPDTRAIHDRDIGRYPSELTDAEYALIAPLIPPPKPGGRPRKAVVRAILNGIFHVVRSGCQWRMIPKDLPPWQTVYGYFRAWSRDGTWEAIHHTLLMDVRENEGKDASPSAPIIDSQSVKTTGKGGLGATTRARR